MKIVSVPLKTEGLYGSGIRRGKNRSSEHLSFAYAMEYLDVVVKLENPHVSREKKAKLEGRLKELIRLFGGLRPSSETCH